jgi:uncharacterized protein involved in exopolysaccharide biosynthesis
MTNNEIKNADFNSANFLHFVYKWKKHLFIIGVAAVIISAVVSFLITPKYKSNVILFPTSTNAVSKALLSDYFGAKQDILEFGEEEQAEQLLQILNSNEIRTRVVKKFNLMKHYGIDSNSNYKMTSLIQEYSDNIAYKRTEYMAVEITVLDKDPQMAADIANYISDMLDTVKNNMQRERAVKAFKIVETEYNRKLKEMKDVDDSLTILRKMGINDYETQAEAINTQLALDISKNNKASVRAMEEKLALLGQYGSAYVSLREAMANGMKQLSILKEKYQEAKVDAEQNLPAKFVVEKAYKAERKSYPVRWIIVMVSTISALFLALIVLIVLESIKRIN